MRKRIQNYAVLRREQAGDHGQIGEIAGAECDGVGGAFELRDFPFHLVMQIDRAGEHAHAAGTGTVTANGFDGGFVDARIADEAEVIV